ncbi:SusD/RagB family nutrient-binding outer membrane lipoprotein [Runella aurantiaca]|uniref:SusD/RagB family nutrient-binding outer membrane lipoprotein n=1 Tax=Runella aurantiaca TaxID=2282308 RepID=A0A369I2Y5_9BACT|nr:SusD/RagB family nutrient-binding outer membrane lipoprotein [Runella aurantiaca]RDB03918.1 SusD/RagB family nutrient-binding outer membrane lipoprotein [Runella aurantiaca]
MNRINNYIKYGVLTVAMLLLNACNLDINTDPNNPSAVSTAQLLTNAQLDIVNSIGSGSPGLSNPAGVFVHQVTQRSTNDQYAITGQDFAGTQAWANLYRAIQNLNVLSDQATANQQFTYAGVAQIMKALAFSYMVDVWGDVPFTEASTAAKIQFPKFDKGQDIYPQLFTLIDEGIANLAKASALSPRTDDLIYAGNLVRWRQFAKSLKLKLYNQIRLVQNVSAPVNALIAEDDLMKAGGNFSLNYGTSSAPDNRHPAFREDYNITTTGRDNYISPYFHEILLGTSTLNPILTGIQDPRIPYYYFNQLSAARPNAQNAVEYRNGNFVSIYFSSQGPNQGFDQSSSIAIIGLYYCGGRFDDGNGVSAAGVSGASARGDGPQRILPYHSHLFTRAELAQTGVSTGNAKQLFSDAINAAFAEVNASAARGGAPAITAAAIKEYVDAVLVKYDAASDSGKLELIMTEKWISNFGFALESYNDIRRTGFPKIYDPNTDGIAFTNVNRGYPQSYPYPTPGELQLNPNAPAQRVVANDKVFWQK